MSTIKEWSNKNVDLYLKYKEHIDVLKMVKNDADKTNKNSMEFKRFVNKELLRTTNGFLIYFKGHNKTFNKNAKKVFKNLESLKDGFDYLHYIFTLRRIDKLLVKASKMEKTTLQQRGFYKLFEVSEKCSVGYSPIFSTHSNVLWISSELTQLAYQLDNEKLDKKYKELKLILS